MQKATGADNFWCSVGVHPTTRVTGEPTVQDLLDRAVCRAVAIGETGLDYYGMEDRKAGVADLEESSASVFAPHPCCARLQQAPGDPYAQCLGRHAAHPCAKRARMVARQRGRRVPLFHRNRHRGAQHSDLGYYISFSASSPSATRKTCAMWSAFVPMDRMLIENRQPYLARAYRGKTNSPAYVPGGTPDYRRARHGRGDRGPRPRAANFECPQSGVVQL